MALLREQLRLKSEENWEAGRLCRENNKPNAATSRYYYALYLSARYWADKRGVMRCADHVPDVHATTAMVVANNAGPNARAFRGIMNALFDLRIIADYRPEPVDLVEVSEVVKQASAARGFFLQ
jgi:hypothetical protein